MNNKILKKVRPHVVPNYVQSWPLQSTRARPTELLCCVYCYGYVYNKEIEISTWHNKRSSRTSYFIYALRLRHIIMLLQFRKVCMHANEMFLLYWLISIADIETSHSEKFALNLYSYTKIYIRKVYGNRSTCGAHTPNECAHQINIF